VLVTSGSQQALEICSRLLVGEGDRVVVEDPGYDGVHNAFLAAGADITRVPVDRNGLIVSALPEGGRPVRLVYVTPSHQFPTGAVMSASRRYALLAWARRRGAHVLEDDYDSEFRYTGRPIEALAALEPGGPVIYCGTFAKSLFPSLRLGYLSLPPGLVAAAVGCKWLSDLGSPPILQSLVGELMARGAYDRHIRRMLRRYRERRDALVAALHAHLGPAIDVDGHEAGLHVLVWLRDLPPDRVDALVARCLERGVGVHSLARSAVVSFDPHAARLPTRRAGLLLGYGVVDVRNIDRGIAVVAAAYREIAGTPAAGRPRARAARRT
jgi:GntR family transcriptional regulator/MocR family aminotransferase